MIYNGIYKGIVLTLCIMFIGNVCAEVDVLSKTDAEKNDFIIQSTRGASQSRQRLREEFGHRLSMYLDALMDMSFLINQCLQHVDNQKAVIYREAIGIDFLQHMCSAKSFLKNGALGSCEVFHCYDTKDRVKWYAYINTQIVIIQKEVIRILRCLIEGDATCCFVSCKPKVQLERYIDTMGAFLKVIYEQNKYLRTIIEECDTI